MGRGKWRTRRPHWWTDAIARARRGCGDGYADVAVRLAIMLPELVRDDPPDRLRMLVVAVDGGVRGDSRLTGSLWGWLVARFTWMETDVSKRHARAFEAALARALADLGPFADRMGR